MRSFAIARGKTAPGRKHLAWLIALLALNASAENLLANPGFEDLAGDRPARWDQFVQPMPGATATLADTAHGGAYAIQLHIPQPYEKEPVNNWSQNIIAELGGATLRVSGFIRVEGATEAAIWLQSWRKRPWGVLGASSTSTDMPVYGTADWQEVSMDVEVPEGTDFVTLRCVLKGSGTAWFDDISVTRVEEEKPNEAEAEAAPADSDEADTEEGEWEPVEPPLKADVAGDQETIMPLFDALEGEVLRLREANSVLTETLQEIQSVNQALLEEMVAVQEELRKLKEEQGKEAPTLNSEKKRVPPLVPLSESQEYGAP